MSPVVGSLESTIHRPSVRYQYRPSVVRQVQFFYFQQGHLHRQNELYKCAGLQAQLCGEPTLSRYHYATVFYHFLGLEYVHLHENNDAESVLTATTSAFDTTTATTGSLRTKFSSEHVEQQTRILPFAE